MATIGSLTANLTLESAAFINNLNRSADSMSRTARQMEQNTNIVTRGFTAATSAVKGFALGIAGAIGATSIAGLVQLGKGALDAAGNLGELAQRAGVTARELQVLELAGLQVGVSQEQMITSLGQFGKRVGEAAQGTGTLHKTLTQYNIALTNSEGGTRRSVDVLGDLANAVQAATSDQEKLRIASEAFGSRVGARLVPLLNEGAEAFTKWAEKAEAAGLIMSDEFIAKADAASDAIATLQFAISKGFQIGVVEEFGSAVTTSAEALDNARVAGEAFGRAIGFAMQFVIDAFRELAPFIETTKQEFYAIQQALVDFGFIGPQSIEQVNSKLEELIVTRRKLSAVAEAEGNAPAETYVVQEVNKEIAALEKLRDSMMATSSAAKPLEVDIRTAAGVIDDAIPPTNDLTSAQKRLAEAGMFLTKTSAQEQRFDHQAEAMKRAADAADNLTGAQKRLAEAGRFLKQTSAQEQRFDRQAEVNAKLAAGMKEQADAQKRLSDEQRRTLDAKAIETERLLNQPFANFLSSLQSETTSVFEEIYSGGVKSFDDLFTTAKDLATRFAAEMTSLLIFSPQALSGAGGMFGAGAAGGIFGPQKGPISLSEPITGVPAGQPITGFNWAGTLGAAGIGGGLGALLGSQMGGGKYGALGGGLGGALGAGGGFALTPFLGPAAPIIGGLLGSVGGSLLGGLFGGGDKDKTKGSFSGGIGNASFGGSSEISNIVKQVDKEILSLLDSRQRAAVARLKDSGNVSVSGGLSASDVESIGSSRIGATAQALGFNKGAILRGDTEQALKNLQTAIATQRAIEELTNNVSTFDRQVEDLSSQFAELRSTARQFGISLTGVAEANTKAYRELIKAQDAQIAALLDPFSALSGPLEAFQKQLEFSGLGPAAQFEKAQAEFERISGLAEGGDIAALGQLQSAGELLIGLAERFGASVGGVAAREDVAEAVSTALERIEAARDQAESSIQDEVRRASREEVTKLDQLIASVEKVVTEIRRSGKKVGA